MTIAITWFVLSIIAGVIAENKGRSGVGLFFLSLCLSPVVGIPAALVIQKSVETLELRELEAGTSRRCPHCAELVKKEASICKHCGRELPPLPDPSPAAQ